MTDRYAVIGNPVEHSKSPAIHAEFARDTGQDMEYGRLLAPIEGFREAVARFRAAGGLGLNVTVPFKQEAWELATHREGYAADAGAVNCLRFEGDRIVGHNTDGTGLVRDLTANIGRVLAGKRILLLGAGGAARGVIGPLLREKPVSLVIANRTIENAQLLVATFNQAAGTPIKGLRFSSFRRLEGEFDIVINATSASLKGERLPLPAGLFARPSVAYDMMYGEPARAFLDFAKAAGATIVSDGLGMLVEQAADSFQIWRGIRPRTERVIDALRAGA